LIDNPTALWVEMTQEREQQLCRAEECAELTIPALFPRDRNPQGARLPVPYQSTGAEGVRSLSSSLQLTLLPTDFPFFRLEPNIDLDRLSPDDRATVDAEMSKLEQMVLREIDALRIRSRLPEALQMVLVGGSAVLDFRKDTPRVHRFENYCFRRDGRGNIAFLVVRESPSVEDLFNHFWVKDSEEVQAALSQELGADRDHPHAALYTVLERQQDGSYKSYQFVCGKRTETSQGKHNGAVFLPGSEETYSGKKPLPWIVLGYKWQDGENYPRSFCDELIGDLDYLNEESRAFAELSAVAARANPMVNPAGLTELDDILEAENLEGIPGREEDVSWLTLDSKGFTALGSIAQVIAEKKRDLQRQFLMFEGVRRDGERVTAVEVQTTALQLEQGLGGFYSQLSEQFQQPLVKIILSRLLKNPENKSFFDGLKAAGLSVTPKIVAGLDILSRGQALQRFAYAMQTAATVLPPEQTVQYINPGAVLQYIFTQVGLPRPDFIRSEEEVQALQAQATQQQALVQSAPQLVKSATELAPENTQAI